MRTRTSTCIGAPLAALLATASVIQGQAPVPSVAGSDLILRAAAGEYEEILSRQGLTVIRCLTALQAGQKVCKVRAAASVTPGQVLTEVTAEEPAVIGMEQVQLVSLPDAYDGVSLNQAAGDVYDALDETGTVRFGKDSTGADRYIWSGYVEQDADSLVRASEARGVANGAGAIVAIIDSGIDPGHPLFDGHLLPGYDFLLDRVGGASEWNILDESAITILGESAIAILGSEEAVEINESAIAILGEDQINQLDLAEIPHVFGHGTMVAGIVHLVAPNAKIMPLRVFDGEGRASVFEVVRAIYYAVEHGATVINMSFSFVNYSQELQAAIIHAVAQGVVCVASVGNDGQDIVVFPASGLEVFGVASADASDYLSSFSNYGFSLATIAAPGEGVITAYPGGGWAAAWGTSFAAPWITGAVALFADRVGTGSPGEIGILEVFDALSVADPLFGANSDRVVHGRIDIKAALDSLGRTDSGPLSPSAADSDSDSDSDSGSDSDSD